MNKTDVFQKLLDQCFDDMNLDEQLTFTIKNLTAIRSSIRKLADDANVHQTIL